MPGFKDFVNLATLLETDMDDLVMKQTVMKLASVAARTAALTGFFREGLVTYLDDLNTLGINTAAADTWSTIGPVHGALTTWVPAVTQSGSVTVTNSFSWYTRVGRLIIGAFTLVVTGSGTASNLITVTLPVTVGSSGVGDSIGTGWALDSSTGIPYPSLLLLHTATTLRFDYTAGGATEAALRLGSGAFTAGLASGDTLSGQFMCQAAADA